MVESAGASSKVLIKKTLSLFGCCREFSWLSLGALAIGLIRFTSPTSVVRSLIFFLMGTRESGSF